jgi:hypothetical protein
MFENEVKKSKKVKLQLSAVCCNDSDEVIILKIDGIFPELRRRISFE